jgi:transcriptional regulator with XRE-family HTH domain
MEKPTETFSFGKFLKFWRDVHHLNQEELAFRLDSSQRHISRLENGSSRPSEHFIEEVARILELGERDRNHLRISAGYSPKQKSVNFNDPELKWLRKAMQLTLKSMEPYPTTLADSSGKLLMVNKGWVGFYQKVLPDFDLSSVTNAYDFIFNHQGFGSVMSNWDSARSMILMALQQEILLHESDDKKALLDRLLQLPNVPDNWKEQAAKLEPMASFRLQIDYEDALTQFYSVNQTVGASGPAAYVSEPNLTISTLYPEDDNLDLEALVQGELAHPLLYE